MSDRTSVDFSHTFRWFLPARNPYLELFTGITTGVGRSSNVQRIHIFQELEDFLDKYAVFLQIHN